MHQSWVSGDTTPTTCAPMVPVLSVLGTNCGTPVSAAPLSGWGLCRGGSPWGGGGSMGVCGAPSRVLTWDVCVHACDVSCGVWVPRACVSPLPGQRWGLRVRLGFLLGFLQGCALLFRRKCPLQLLQCSHLSRAHWVGAGCGQWLEGPGGPALAGPEGHETVVGIPMTWKCLGHPCPTHAQSPGRTVPSDHRSRSCRPGRGRPGGEGRRTPSAPAALPSQQWPPRPPAHPSAHLPPIGSKLALRRMKGGPLAVRLHITAATASGPKSVLGPHTRPEGPQKATSSSTTLPRGLGPGLPGPCEVWPPRVYSPSLL